MRHRHFSNSFPGFGIDQHDNNHTPVDPPYFPTGRPVAQDNGPGPFVGQMNHHHHHMSRGGAQNRNMEISRTNEYPPSSNITMEIQPFVPTTFSHPPVPENRSLPPGGHIHSTNYNIPSTHDLEAGPIANQGRLKRKRSGSLNSLYTAGSSSTSASSSQMPMEKPALDYRGSLTIDGQDSSRNVRRRYRHDDDVEPSITRPHVPNQFYQPTPHPPNYSSPVQHPNPGHWNCAPQSHYPAPSHRRLSPSDMSGSRHEMSQFHVGGSSGDSVFTRPSQNLHGPHTNHSRRLQSSYGNGSRYSHYAHGGTSSANGMRTPPEDFSSRNTRHCSPGGWRGNYRSGRPRIAVERFHSVLDVTEAHDRIGHENNMMMVDRASFYGNSRNVSDQYRDLRLDIDNMSYEELLNLEERIGNVNTGLSEDSMSKCLREKVYYSSDQSHEEVSCPICLEEYKDGDNVGTMEKCGHDYHVDCIKKWLLMKKLCPICKTECPNQEQREG